MATKQILNSSTAPDGSQYVTLTDGAGNLVTAGGASGITIGTTSITGGATTQVLFNLAGVVSSDTGLTYAGSSGAVTLGTDANLIRDASNILAQRNSTTAQAFKVYNTFTDASNYERGIFDFKKSSNVLLIGSEAAGTGTIRNVTVGANPGGSSGAVWILNANGSASLAIGGVGNEITMATNGVVMLNTGVLQLGGTTSSFPRIDNSGAKLRVRLADNTADAQITAATVNLTNFTVATLPSAVPAGQLAFVTDATLTAITGLGLAVIGSGTNKVVVYSDGTNWLIL